MAERALRSQRPGWKPRGARGSATRSSWPGSSIAPWRRHVSRRYVRGARESTAPERSETEHRAGMQQNSAAAQEKDR
eukprot:scaffold2771_cov252-Pinguiococcus_pyrenoidosus.AAC.21